MMTQGAWTLRRLRKGPLTSVQAYEESSADPSVKPITRLSAVIIRLRKKHQIHTDTLNRQTGFCRYVLISEAVQNTLPGLAA